MNIKHRTGDVDPIAYGGGVVVWVAETTHHEWWFWDAPENEGDDFTVYTAVVEPDTLGWYDWFDLEQLATFIGLDVEELTRLAKSRKIIDRVAFIEVGKNYYGSFELDPYPQTLSEDKLRQLIGLTENH